MAALVQSYPQPPGTVTMLQSRPSSSSAMMSAGPAQAGHQFGPGSSQQRSSSHGVSGGGGGPMVYRGATALIQPYAFTTTPGLNNGAQWQQARASRTVSTTALPSAHSLEQDRQRGRFVASAPLTSVPGPSTMAYYAPGLSRDDSTLPGPVNRRVSPSSRPPSSRLGPSSQSPSAPFRHPPERYRRPSSRATDSFPSSSSGHSFTDHNKVSFQRNQYISASNRPASFVGLVPGATLDDMHLRRGQFEDDVKRLRRRSMPALDFVDASQPLTASNSTPPAASTRGDQAALTRSTNNDGCTIAGQAPADEPSSAVSGSGVSGHTPGTSPPSSSTKCNVNVTTSTGNPALPPPPVEHSSTEARLVNIPSRSSSSDAANTTAKKDNSSSPSSDPVNMDLEVAKTPVAAAAPAPDSSAETVAVPSPRFASPAARQLAAIKEKGTKPKSKTSRLRRAFSFGSAAEFKRVVNPEAEDNEEGTSAAGNAPGKLHKEPTADELYDAEQERIAQRQEAAGIGNNIYSGGRLFSSSTDNISISSTASSASIMIRKMGRGMKKGGRSLVGLFRPKSVIGVPAVDALAPEATPAEVSMITVEAERERVNVNPDPHTQIGGGTGFPRLELNSADMTKDFINTVSDRLSMYGLDQSSARKSIVGGEKERAEVLAAVRKGILKNTSASSSPGPREPEVRAPAFELPVVPRASESPASTAPSTPNDESQGHRRTGSVAIGSEDYFMSALRLRQDSKSNPGTPHAVSKRNATFSPRLMFYDTWPSQEYDRRGEIATCNRLTPMLAQQIKEELNTFKMEMEVHENSKIYTHFF